MAHYPVFSISSGAQTASELIFGGAALLSLLYCVRIARRERKVWPLAVFGGSMLLVSYEPINNFLGHCAYPTPGQHTMLSYLGQHVPVSTWFIYMFYFSVAVPFVMQKLEQGLTMRQLAQYYAVAVVICAAFEPLFANVHLGVRWWFYYGSNQALNFTGLPMFWWFANAMVVLVMAMIFYLLRRHLFDRDWQSWAFVPLAPLVLIGIHGTAGVPYYIAVTSTTGKTWSTIGTLGSIAISVFYMLLFGKAVTVPARASTWATFNGRRMAPELLRSGALAGRERALP
ncbi:MAG: hypothetical protein ACYDHH_33305 [Solirubrobacteraceae bacterium]